MLRTARSFLRNFATAMVTALTLMPCPSAGGATALSPAEQNAPKPITFDDESLHRLLGTDAQGVIYVWSSRMPFSVTGLAEIEHLAKTLSFDLLVLVDPYGATPVGSLPLTSQKLISRGALNHFPALITYQNGRLDDGVMLGYSSPGDLTEFLAAKRLILRGSRE